MRSMSLEFLSTLSDPVREITTSAPNCYLRRKQDFRGIWKTLWKRSKDSEQNKKECLVAEGELRWWEMHKWPCVLYLHGKRHENRHQWQRQWGQMCGVTTLPIHPSISITTWLNIPIAERLLLNHANTSGFLAPGGEEFNTGPETRLDRSELLCNKVLLKYKGDRESFWHRHQKGQKEYPLASVNNEVI